MARLSVALSFVDAEARRLALSEEAVAMARQVRDVSALGYSLASHCDAAPRTVRPLPGHGLRQPGRRPLPGHPEGFTAADLADDAAHLLRALGVRSAHIAGFSGGAVTPQELALRHPDVVTSLGLVSAWGRADAYLRAMTDAWKWQIENAPGQRAALKAFFVWVYTCRVLPGEAHQPFQERPDEFNALIDAFWSNVDGRA